MRHSKTEDIFVRLSSYYSLPNYPFIGRYGLLFQRSNQSLGWDARALSFRETNVELREIHSILVAHVRRRLQGHAKTLTKNEVEKLMTGYPPFYREKITLEHGPAIDFPIRNDSDITRGGWVIAVGLWKLREPLSLYIIADADEYNSLAAAPTNGKSFSLVVSYCGGV
jgi:hypothetical protein